MSDTKNNLEEYFDNESSKQQKAELKKRISQNEDDQIMLDLSEAVQMKNEVDQLHDRINSLGNTKSRSLYIGRIAAAITLIALASVFIYLFTQNTSTADLFSSYYQPYDGVVVLRGETSTLEKGMKAYNAGDFQAALSFLLNADVDEITPGQQKLLISSCYLSLNDPEKSLSYLESGFENELSLIQNNRLWLMALSYLKKGDIEPCKELLDELLEIQSPFANQASELLEELD